MKNLVQPKLRWEKSDWLKRAGDWIQLQTSRRAIKITGPIEQPHIYYWSTVLRIPTNEGMLFFKATAPETVHEIALTQALASWYPDTMPELVAFDVKRGWMLMRDGGEPLRASIRPTKDITPWTPILPLYAQLQIGLAERVPELLALGLPDRRLARLPGLYLELLTDLVTLRVDQPNGLTSGQFRHLQELAPRFAQICDDLAAVGIPESLNHGDFHDGNVLLRDGRVTFFDWGDASATHPFVSLRTFSVSIENSLKMEDYSFTPEMTALVELYLEQWQRFAPNADLKIAYALSRCVASIVSALSWYNGISKLEAPFREKYEGIVPELFREFLEYEKMLQA